MSEPNPNLSAELPPVTPPVTYAWQSVVSYEKTPLTPSLPDLPQESESEFPYLPQQEASVPFRQIPIPPEVPQFSDLPPLPTPTQEPPLFSGNAIPQRNGEPMHLYPTEERTVPFHNVNLQDFQQLPPPQEAPRPQMLPDSEPWEYPPESPVYVAQSPVAAAPAAFAKQTRTPQQKRHLALLWLAVLLPAALFVYCIVSDIYAYNHGISASRQETPELVVTYQEKPVTEEITKPDANGKYTVAGAAEAVAPSIVAVHAYVEDALASSGSGIILSSDGYIVTNAHVLQGAEEYSVLLSNEEELFAECVGMDSKTDLAVLKVKASDLPVAVIGNADDLVVGEEVVAIGNPAGLSGTVTNGIVSAMHRQIRNGSTGFDMDCIQTNAAISPGNSGGALVNLYGQVVGITSSKYASLYSGTTYEGLGFAISVNEAMPILEELVSQGYVSGRVRVGITFRSLSVEEVAVAFREMHGLPETEMVQGLWISEIAEECDIAKSGLLVDDVIVQVDGVPVMDYDSLNAILEEHKGGDRLKAKCLRYGINGEVEEVEISFLLMEDRSGEY